MSVRDNGVGLRNRRVPAEIAAAVSRAARILSIEALLHRRPYQLSGGQQQRVALAAASCAIPRSFCSMTAVEPDAQLRAQMRLELRSCDCGSNDLDLRDPRPDRSDDARRPDRGHEGRLVQQVARRSSSTADPRPVRGELHRLTIHEFPHGQRDGGRRPFLAGLPRLRSRLPTGRFPDWVHGSDDPFASACAPNIFGSGRPRTRTHRLQGNRHGHRAARRRATSRRSPRRQRDPDRGCRSD